MSLAARGYKVTGVDIAPTAVRWAQERAESGGLAVDFRVGDVVNLSELADATFDGVVDGHCLHCIIGALSQFDAETSVLMSGGRPVRTIGRADGIVAEVARAGFDVVSAQLRPRRHASEQDDLFVLARKHIDLPADGFHEPPWNASRG